MYIASTTPNAKSTAASSTNAHVEQHKALSHNSIYLSMQIDRACTKHTLEEYCAAGSIASSRRIMSDLLPTNAPESDWISDARPLSREMQPFLGAIAKHYVARAGYVERENVTRTNV